MLNVLYIVIVIISQQNKDYSKTQILKNAIKVPYLSKFALFVTISVYRELYYIMILTEYNLYLSKSLLWLKNIHMNDYALFFSNSNLYTDTKHGLLKPHQNSCYLLSLMYNDISAYSRHGRVVNK